MAPWHHPDTLWTTASLLWHLCERVYVSDMKSLLCKESIRVGVCSVGADTLDGKQVAAMAVS